MRHQQQQQQQERSKQHTRETNDSMAMIDRASELALDNLNVIYDNDTEHIDLSPPQQQQQQEQLLVAGNERGQRGSNGSVKQAKSSFVHGEHFDDIQEQQDAYATCLLEPIKRNSADDVVVTNLTGRLNFWQPIQNRGVLHLIARFRYVSTATPRGAGEPGDLATARGAREKRESFQTPIEHRPPILTELDRQKHDMVVQKQRHHQIWLLKECPDSLTSNDINSDNSNGTVASAQAESQARQVQSGTLLAEVKSKESQGTIDIDAESVVGKFNLTDTNSIMNKCLELSFGTSELPRDESSTKGSSALSPDGPKTLGFCKIVQSKNLPPVGELEHLPSVSEVQPIREDLLFASSPSPSTSFSSPSQSSSTPKLEALKWSLEMMA